MWYKRSEFIAIHLNQTLHLTANYDIAASLAEVHFVENHLYYQIYITPRDFFFSQHTAPFQNIYNICPILPS